MDSTLGKALMVLGAVVAAPFLILLGTLLAPLGGALCAIIVAHFFPDTMHHILAYTTFQNPAELGAALGFVGSFFRTVQTNNVKKD